MPGKAGGWQGKPAGGPAKPIARAASDRVSTPPMTRRSTACLPLALLCIAALGSVARGDEQVFAPGTAQQDAVVINTGADGLCQTAAASGDIQLAELGSGSPFRNGVRCGLNQTADTTAGGDDRQLVAIGRACNNANTPIIDTGPNGISDSTAVGDDTQVIAPGVAPANQPCVIAGANGIADTPDPPAGDDARVLAFGTATPNTTAIRCGGNQVADTTANNVDPSGDDVQLVAVGSPCANANTPVVDSGPDGIADTRAEGADLVVSSTKPVKVNIGRGRERATKLVKVTVSNREFGATAPAARGYVLRANAGSCPGGTVSQIDADATLPGLQATGTVARGSRVKATFVVTARLEDYTTVDSNAPARCQVDVEAEALDTTPDLDDAGDIANNAAPVTLEVVDRNDQL